MGKLITHFAIWSVVFWAVFGLGDCVFVGTLQDAQRLNALGSPNYAMVWWNPLAFAVVPSLATGAPLIFWPLVLGFFFGFSRKR